MNKKNIFVLMSLVYCLFFDYSGIGAKFLLIMGPSGVGKSTIIQYLKKRDARFIYISPLTTRELRDGETDKIHATLEEMKQLDAEGRLLVINEFYGIHYATPKDTIDNALAVNNFPVLDWPIDKIAIMESCYSGDLYKVYIEPDSIEELAARLKNDARDVNGKRYAAGLLEINNLHEGKYDAFIDLRLVNDKGHAEDIAELIYNSFLQCDH